MLIHLQLRGGPPSLAEPRESFALKRRVRNYRGSFQSRYGYTDGKAAPAEARALWSRWYGWGRADESCPEETRALVRSVVANIERYVGAPFVTKNPDHCNRIRALDATFSDALFVRIKRPPAETARSILDARRRYLGSYERWFGVRIPGRDDIEYLASWEQTVRQIYHLERTMDEDFVSMQPSTRVFVMDYATFCKRPAAEMERLRDFAAANGLELSVRFPLPERFVASTGPELPPQIERALNLALAQFFDGDTPRLQPLPSS